MSEAAFGLLTFSYIANLAVLVPLLFAFALRPSTMDNVFGQDSDARRILVCLYATIALASLVGLGMQTTGAAQMALHLAVPLFTVQIVYKLKTVFAVGLKSPVVKTNLVIVAIHSGTLALILT